MEKKQDEEQKTEVEIGVIQLQTKEYGESPEAKRGKRGLSPSASGGSLQPC